MIATAILSVVAAGASLYAALLAARFSRAPGWAEQRCFALLAAVGAVYAACNLASTSAASGDRLVLAMARIQLALGAAQASIWIRYAEVHLRRGSRPWDLRAAWAVAALGLPALLPGAAFTGRVETVEVAGLVQRVARVNAFGGLIVAAILAAMGLAAVRFALAARKGVSHAWLHAVGLAVLLAAAANDGLVVAGAVRMPYLAPLGIVVVILAVGLALADRFVEQARTLVGVRGRLEEAVGERTGELAAREAALLRAEHLAALGRLAAGVAHEIAGPAAAASTNVNHVAEGLRRGALPSDALASLEESQQALGRISRSLRHLHDAERVALSPGAGEPVALARAVEEAVEQAQAHGQAQVPVAVEVADDLRARGEWRVVAELIALAVAEVAQVAARCEAELTVRAERVGERVRLVVECRRVPGQLRLPELVGDRHDAGAALGLAVARGLAVSLGGGLSVEGAGARLRVVVDLPAGYT